MTKSRREAQTLIGKRKLRLTRAGETTRVTKPHFQVRAGDQLSFMRHKGLVHVEMIAPGTRRGPAPEAQTLYLDLTTEDAPQTRSKI
ncbi:hypothetical protein GCM10007853_26880 [Algimonas ampicilliniresistens]|uniref:RNA-binding S4 domain-containing protein n=1 Tax=Algimonas ampicilliniresistens TaxID=1298735 RepID=A0ABQ5VBE0_9PROT|nr:RNA-binding S4 domain-containing protein [Algimonas ampicilliniresistens]GLQ24814.1 hypothetical protein GCM10007853_26880 [Algimonas ampicilliniresistens]